MRTVEMYKNFINYPKRKIFSIISRMRIKNRNFSIFSSNCLGAAIYRELGLRYTTPSVGLFFHGPCYVKLMSNFEYYLSQELRFSPESKYPLAQKNREQRKYPIGILGDDIEIHFLHYINEDEARTKWKYRLKRLNWENLFFLFLERDLCTPVELKIFDQINYKQKIAFTAFNYPDLKSSIWLPECQKYAEIIDLIACPYIYRRHFDFIDWLNGGTGDVCNSQRILNEIIKVCIN